MTFFLVPAAEGGGKLGEVTESNGSAIVVVRVAEVSAVVRVRVVLGRIYGFGAIVRAVEHTIAIEVRRGPARAGDPQSNKARVAANSVRFIGGSPLQLARQLLGVPLVVRPFTGWPLERKRIKIASRD